MVSYLIFKTFFVVSYESRVLVGDSERWKKLLERLFNVLMGMTKITVRRLELIERKEDESFNLLEKKI